MATDPALLFYTSDFLTGTYTMTNEQVGMYVRLLCLQHQKEKLSEKDMLNVCGTYVEDVFSKFKKEGQYFYNERLRAEAERRKNFCESRRLARQGSKNKEVKQKRMSNVRESYVRRMETETETEIVDVNESILGKSENPFVENWDSVKLNFFNAYQWKEKFCRDKKIDMPDLEEKMNEFISDIELREEYKPLKDLKSHFTNRYNKNQNGNTHQRTFNPGNKLGTSEARTQALKNL